MPRSYKFSEDPQPFFFDFVSDAEEQGAAAAWVRLEGSEADAMPDQARHDALEARIVAFLSRSPRSTTTTIREAAGGNANAILGVLGDLEAQGLLTCEKGQRNAKLWSVAPVATQPAANEGSK